MDSVVSPILQKDLNMIWTESFADTYYVMKLLAELRTAAVSNNSEKRRVLATIPTYFHNCKDAFVLYYKYRSMTVKPTTRLVGTIVAIYDLDISFYFSQLIALASDKTTGKQTQSSGSNKHVADTDDTRTNNDAILSFVTLIPQFIAKLNEIPQVTVQIIRFGFNYKEGKLQDLHSQPFLVTQGLNPDYTSTDASSSSEDDEDDETIIAKYKALKVRRGKRRFHGHDMGSDEHGDGVLSGSS